MLILECPDGRLALRIGPGAEKWAEKIRNPRIRKDTESVFLGAQRTGDLARMDRCRTNLAQDGALWVVYPKGRQDITRGDVMKAGKMAGLVDVKIVKFSESHTALKFVIPLAKRLNKW